MTETSPAILRVRDLRKNYRSGETTLEVLRGVDFDLAAGEFVSIVGQSGSGKSTLLHLMGLLDAADSGSIELDGTRIDGLSSARRDRLRNTCVGMVFQSYHLLPELDALENVLAPLMVRHGVLEWLRVRHQARDTARALLDRFGLGSRLRHKPRQLSGGEMQRTAIARALIHGPAVLLADEPTGNLDSANGANILSLLSELTDETKTALVLVTHSAEATAICHRIVQMRDGSLQSSGR